MDNIKCPHCDLSMVKRSGPHGAFYGCSTYFETRCKGTRSLKEASTHPSKQVKKADTSIIVAIHEKNQAFLELKRYDTALSQLDKLVDGAIEQEYLTELTVLKSRYARKVADFEAVSASLHSEDEEYIMPECLYVKKTLRKRV